MLFSTASISDLLYNSYRMFDIEATDVDIHNGQEKETAHKARP